MSIKRSKKPARGVMKTGLTTARKLHDLHGMPVTLTQLSKLTRVRRETVWYWLHKKNPLTVQEILNKSKKYKPRLKKKSLNKRSFNQWLLLMQSDEEC